MTDVHRGDDPGEMLVVAFGYCPDCLARVDLSRVPKVGHVATCPCCRAHLRVSELNPLQIEWVAEAADEGWEADWEVELERVVEPCPRS